MKKDSYIYVFSIDGIVDHSTMVCDNDMDFYKRISSLYNKLSFDVDIHEVIKQEVHTYLEIHYRFKFSRYKKEIVGIYENMKEFYKDMMDKYRLPKEKIEIIKINTMKEKELLK